MQMRPLYDAGVHDLCPGDLAHVECTVLILPEEAATITLR
jgi:hypothetical protein